jgi:hypothetical protein
MLMPADNREPKMDLRQTTFLEEEEGARAPEVSRSTLRGSKRSSSKESIQAMLIESLVPLAEQLQRIHAMLDTLAKQVLSQQLVKEYYSTKEAAKVLGKRPYTVREWCRMGRIRAEKADFGRGLDEEWRISHDELVRIQNEGLMTLKPESRIGGPRRVAKKQAG